MVKDPVSALPVQVIIFNLIKNPAYIFSVIAMTNICFVVTGLQNWTTYYMTTVLKGEEQTVYLLFSGAALTGPAIGGLSGGLLTSKYLGGYTSKKAIYFCFITFLCLVAVSIPAPFIDNLWAFIALIWL